MYVDQETIGALACSLCGGVEVETRMVFMDVLGEVDPYCPECAGKVQGTRVDGDRM